MPRFLSSVFQNWLSVLRKKTDNYQNCPFNKGNLNCVKRKLVKVSFNYIQPYIEFRSVSARVNARTLERNKRLLRRLYLHLKSLIKELAHGILGKMGFMISVLNLSLPWLHYHYLSVNLIFSRQSNFQLSVERNPRLLNWFSSVY